MHTTLDRIFTRYPIKSRRAMEITPPLIALFLISMPIWGAYFFPIALSYFIIFFDVYWFYKAVNLVIMSFIAARKIRAAEKTDWLAKANVLPNFSKVSHLIIIPSYKESYDKIKETIESIFDQTFPKEQIYIYMAFEAREESVRDKADKLKNEYEKLFGGFDYALHPDLPEVIYFITKVWSLH